MKKPRTRLSNDYLWMQHEGLLYHFPKKIAEKYCVDTQLVNAEEVFAELNKKYTKPGALLRGLRAREGLTQVALALKIKVTQSDISQMEKGTRKIGRKIAKRFEKLFGMDYRSFLD